MAKSIEITSIDDQIPVLPQTENDEVDKKLPMSIKRKKSCVDTSPQQHCSFTYEIFQQLEEGKKVGQLIDRGHDPSGSQTNKFENQFFDGALKDYLNNPSTKSCTIFKVNVWLRESKPDAYTPMMLFIGPYHKKKIHLDPMKSYKFWYLQRFLQRKDGLNVESCIRELEKLKEEALKCYDHVETDNFCEMLLLDGCFVVEFIRERCEIYPEGKKVKINNVCHIFRDLMLLENQLPFFVLNKLHHMTMQDDELPLAISVSNSFSLFVDLPKMTLEFYRETARCNIKHLLHLVHILSCRGNPMKKPKDDPMWHKVMPNATELSEAGVSFAKGGNVNSNKENFTSLFDIKFENGLMTIPCFRVEDLTETLLRNLIAYEQQSCDVNPTYFSDYAIFMDHLIDSDKDVNLLRQKGIIVNFIGEDKEVASLFNKIGSGVTIHTDFYYKEVFRKAFEHCQKPWNSLKANLVHNYFSSPWVGASTVAAIILLILTAIQTILAITGSIK